MLTGNFFRYSLNGCPLDPVLFDAVPQPLTNPQSPPVVNGLSGLSLAVKGALPSGNSDHESWSGVNSPLACQGLLEVQPLHFVCCSTSDGARVERGDTQQLPGGSLGPTGPSVSVPMMSGGMPSSSTLAPTLPNVTDSLVALEVELQMLKVIARVALIIAKIAGNFLEFSDFFSDFGGFLRVVSFLCKPEKCLES